MKRNYKAEFKGYQKRTPGWALKLSNIKDERNVVVAREGKVNLTKNIGYLGKLEKGDLLEFSADVKEISFEYPQKVRRTNKKMESEKRNNLSLFFDIDV